MHGTVPKRPYVPAQPERVSSGSQIVVDPSYAMARMHYQAEAGPGTAAYRRLRRGLAFIVWLFFRRVEVVGLENLPTDRGGIFVAGHPNGLIDPALILTAFPGQVVFGARHGLFRWPVIG